MENDRGSRVSVEGGSVGDEILDRDVLRQKLEDRQRELEIQKQNLRQLQQETNISNDTIKEESAQQSVNSLISDVLASLQALPKPIPAAEDDARPSLIAKKSNLPSTSGLAFKIQKNVDSTIKPKTVERFEKSCQADIEVPKLNETVAHELDGPDTISAPLMKKKTNANVVLAEDLLGGSEAFLDDFRRQIKEKAKMEEPPAAPLTEGEKKEMMGTPEFEDFFDHASKIMERLLGQNDRFDPFHDFSGIKKRDLRDQEKKLIKVDKYVDSRYSAHRPILDLRCSPLYPEVFIASYGGKKSGGGWNDYEGCIGVWSLAMSQRPEYIFTSQSPICSAMFNQYSPNMIIGGTYTGSLLLFDTRAQSKPIQRTPLSSRAHTHPVLCMEIVGTANAHNLVTVDSDGRLCQWSLSMFGAPSSFIDLKKPQTSKDLGVECIAFKYNEVNTLMVGCEDGDIHLANILGTKAGTETTIQGHTGPLTSLHYHPGGRGNVGDENIINSSYHFSELMLSTSVDWTCKLWSDKNFDRPLASFEVSECYVYDAQWHPTNPCVFATVNGEGYLDLWNLAKDWETPYYRVQCGGTGIGGGLERGLRGAKNCLCWLKDGQRLCVADPNGSIELYSVCMELLQPRNDDIDKFERKLEDAKPENALGSSLVDISLDEED